MEGKLYEELTTREGAIPLAHPDFTAAQFHRDMWKQKGVTIVVCQRQTKEFTQLCIESILRFYPDIPIVVIDGDSQDDSTLYLRYKALTTPNLRLHNHIGRNSHGEILDYAFKNLVETEYALTMDSDTIMVRGGWIEHVRNKFNETPKPYAVGHLMLVTYEGYGCGVPNDENDVLRYAHPSCAMFDVKKYLELDTPFNDNGAPLAHNMRAAQDRGLEVRAFQIDKYVVHRTGSSWVKEHKIVWPHDHDVFIRPFFTFLFWDHAFVGTLENQSDRDFNVTTFGYKATVRIWETTTRDIDNPFFENRFSINGEYVIEIEDQQMLLPMESDFVSNFKKVIIEQGAPETGEVNGIKFYSRKYFQNNIALY